MTWTTEPPKIDGWYWTRLNKPMHPVYLRPRCVELWTITGIGLVYRGRRLEMDPGREWWSERIPEPAP